MALGWCVILLSYLFPFFLLLLSLLFVLPHESFVVKKGARGCMARAN